MKTLIFSILILIASCQPNSVNIEQNNSVEMESTKNSNNSSSINSKNHLDTILELYSDVHEISNYGENIENLNETQKIVLWIENLEMEVNNGGFHQFFFNSSGDYAMETLIALEKIGANKTLEILKNVIAEWPNSSVPKNRTERIVILEKIEKKAEQKWGNCDTKFFKYEDDITALLWQYVIMNKENL